MKANDNTTPALVNIKNTADNVVTMAELGITISGTIKAAEGAGKGSIEGMALNLFGGGVVDAAIGFISPWLDMFTFVCQMSMGFFLMCSIYLPLVPFIVFMGLVMEWLVSVMVGVTAAPLLAFAHFDTDGEGLGQKTNHGYGFMLQIFLRPIFIVLGFILSAAAIEISIFFLTANFGMAVKDAQVHSITGLLSIFGYCAIYMTLAVGLVNASAALMHKVPDAIWEWMGLPRASFGMDTSQQAMMAAGTGAGISRVGTKSGKSAGDVKDASTSRAKNQMELAAFREKQAGDKEGSGLKG